MRQISFLFAVLFMLCIAKAQNPQWITYSTDGNHVTSIVIERDYLWIGTRGGNLVKINKKNHKKIFITKNYPGFPNCMITSLAIDNKGNKWIGTAGGGLVKFDGSTWTVYNKNNSGLSSNYVKSLAIDAQGNKWIGTWYNGLVVFNEKGVVISTK